MKQRIPIHTTLDVDTYYYIKRMQAKHGINMNTAIERLVETNKECKIKLEKKILTEVVNHVIDFYINSEEYSNN